VAWTCDREQSIRAAVPQLFERATTQPTATLPGSGVVQWVEAGALPAVIKELPVVEFERGHTIYAEGEHGDRLYIIVSGKVKLARRSPDGRHKLLTVIGPSDMFGAPSALDGGPRTASAATLTEVCAVSMDRDAIHAWITRRPEAAEQLLALLARRLRRTDTDLTDLISLDGDVHRLPADIASGGHILHRPGNVIGFTELLERHGIDHRLDAAACLRRVMDVEQGR
jgi:CRP-like cAMP-binding protein